MLYMDFSRSPSVGRLDCDAGWRRCTEVLVGIRWIRFGCSELGHETRTNMRMWTECDCKDNIVAEQIKNYDDIKDCKDCR